MAGLRGRVQAVEEGQRRGVLVLIRCTLRVVRHKVRVVRRTLDLSTYSTTLR